MVKPMWKQPRGMMLREMAAGDNCQHWGQRSKRPDRIKVSYLD